MAEQQSPIKTYRGNCHCTAYVFEVTLPEITNASECNCSICYKKAALWVFPKPGDVKFVKGDPATLTDYAFGKKRFTHRFCSTCGNSLMVVGHLTPPKPGEDKQPEHGVNVRTFQHGQVNVWDINLDIFDGASLRPAYEAPKFTGPEPTAEVEGGKLYTGSCHCGAVTLAFKSKPLDKDFPGLTECNCSSCGRQGAVWTYPHKTQVVIVGQENLGLYLFGKKSAGKTFCKICGVPVHNQMMQFTEEEIAAMSEATRKWCIGGKDLAPINLRLINDLNVKDLNVDRFDGYAAIQPPYVEP
ncbi:glutathione-dependent formaldehyde-activating enzyme [Xylariaceae sp. AK1471]|nr:glutathione-dependent formaldehyde-activating enzyme [Xylariaceae sp. AK1471]